MKITWKILSALIILVSLCGCSVNTGTASSVVHLCDYKNMDVTEEMYWVSEADLNTAMTMYAISTDEALEDYTGLTDEIVKQYYGYDTVAALKDKALLDIIMHRIVAAVYEQILLNSNMDFHNNDPYFENYHTARLCSVEYLSRLEGTTTSDFLEQSYQMTEIEFWDSEVDFFVTVNILKELLDTENQTSLQSEIERTRFNLAQEWGCSVEETHKILLDEDLFYELAESKIHELISQWYATEIYEAFVAVKQTQEPNE